MSKVCNFHQSPLSPRAIMMLVLFFGISIISSLHVCLGSFAFLVLQFDPKNYEKKQKLENSKNINYSQAILHDSKDFIEELLSALKDSECHRLKEPKNHFGSRFNRLLKLGVSPCPRNHGLQNEDSAIKIQNDRQRQFG